MAGFDAWQHLQNWQNERDRHAANGGGIMHIFATLDTNGPGEVAFQDPIMFGIRFIDTPSPDYGVELDASTPLISTRFPRATGFVSSWVVDAQNFFIGAYVAVATTDSDVSVPTTAPNPNYLLHHHWHFAGLGLRTGPEALIQ